MQFENAFCLADDIRVIIIQIADRLDAIRHIKLLSEKSNSLLQMRLSKFGHHLLTDWECQEKK